MLSLAENKRLWRGLLLGLLLVALMGPWVFDLIHVPAEYPCSAPFIRLEGDYCGVPLTGPWILMALGGLLTLPLISTATLLLRGDRRGLVVFHLVALILPLGALVLMGWFSDPRFSRILWGPWLYAAAAAGGLLLELARLALDRRAAAV